MQIWATPLRYFFYLQSRHRLLVLFLPQGPRGQIAKASSDRGEQ